MYTNSHNRRVWSKSIESFPYGIITSCPLDKGSVFIQGIVCCIVLYVCSICLRYNAIVCPIFHHWLPLYVLNDIRDVLQFMVGSFLSMNIEIYFAILFLFFSIVHYYNKYSLQ